MAMMMSAREAAERWGISQRRVAVLCKEGRIQGAVLEGNRWLLPVTTPKPADNRVKTGAYRRESSFFVKEDVEAYTWGAPKLPLPVGVSDYRRAATEYYYVDKTLLIKELLDERAQVSLFTRPRRFGKTLNMDMFRTFFEKTEEDTSVYFQDKAIWQCGERYRAEQGKYPVIFISFKDVKYATWEETIAKMGALLSEEFRRHPELGESAKIDKEDKRLFQKIAGETTDVITLTGALSGLTRMLHQHYGVAPVLIIDEYDTPIQQGYRMGYYEDVISFIRNLFSEGLKDNRHLSFGILTGILRVARESIFSGMNNLVVNSILNTKYASYFGFLPEEVERMATYYGLKKKLPEIKEWYDGYLFGGQEIYNPWSVINYLRNDGKPDAYWQSTGSNVIIGDIMTEASAEIYKKLTSLVKGEEIVTIIDDCVIYPEVKQNTSSFFSFLMMAGYLKAMTVDFSPVAGLICRAKIPNQEIKYVYQKEILDRLAMSIPGVSGIQEALYTGNEGLLETELKNLLQKTVSFYDTTGENFYHGLLLGLCAMMESQFTILSNREAGDGRFDIELMPKREWFPIILIEIKATKDSKTDLQTLAHTAIQQIDEKHYAPQGKDGLNILKYGVAFRKKEACVVLERG